MKIAHFIKIEFTAWGTWMSVGAGERALTKHFLLELNGLDLVNKVSVFFIHSFENILLVTASF